MPVANKKFIKDKRLLYSGIAMFTFSSFLLFGQGTANADQNTSNNNQSENTTAVASDATSNSTAVLSADSAQNVVASAVNASTQIVSASAVTSSTSVAENTSAAAASDSVVASQVASATTSTIASTSSSVSAVASSSAQSVSSANVIELVNPTDDEITQAKSAAVVAYAATGQVQTIKMVASSSSTTTSAFLASIKAGAIQGWVQYGVLPSVTAAQAILESASGTSGLATKGNNLFGIKGSYNGQSITMKTSEWGGSGYYTTNAAFRKYDNYSESVVDHGRFLYVNSRYSNIIHNRNYVSVANNLRADGYATDPSYPSKIINLIQAYGLTSWDAEAFALTDKVNTGNLENVSISGNTLNLSGWHVATDAAGKGNEYIILLDAANGKEISRYKVTPSNRADVQKVYSSVSTSLKSGFNVDIPYSSALAGKKITVISRYTASNDGNSNYVDYSFSVNLSINAGYLDTFNVLSDGNMHVSGWNANDMSINKQYHYIIIYDSTTKKEITRVRVNNTARSDVAAAQKSVYGAANSGFSIVVPFTSKMVGDYIQIVSRYSDSANGEGNHTDFWFGTKTFNENIGSLDNFKVSGTQLVVNGWHAADSTVNKPYHYVIVYDATKNKEIERVLVDSTLRSDVVSAHGNVYGSKNSGFSINVAFTNAMVGDKIQIVSRYTDNKGNNTDYWFNAQTFNQNMASLDNFEIVGNQLVISGWHAADSTVNKDTHYIIIYDATTNKEITRVLSSSTIRNDVAKVNGDVYNAAKSGFSINIPLTKAMIGDKIQVVSRYTNSNGQNTDYWFGAQTFDANIGSIDSVKRISSTVTVNGWHASDMTIGKPYHFVIIWDSTTGKELGRYRVTNTQQRLDVQQKYSDVYNSLNSGFKVTIPNLVIPNGDKIQVISRYSSANNGQSNYVDYWSPVFKF